MPLEAHCCFEALYCRRPLRRRGARGAGSICEFCMLEHLHGAGRTVRGPARLPPLYAASLEGPSRVVVKRREARHSAAAPGSPTWPHSRASVPRILRRAALPPGPGRAAVAVPATPPTTIFPLRTTRLGRWLRRACPATLAFAGWLLLAAAMNLATWGPLLMGLHHPYAPLLASSAFLFTFVLLPCIDVVLGAEPFPEPFASHPEASPSLIQSDALFRINVRALVPVHAATVLGLAHAVTVAVAQGAPAAVWAGWVASLVPFGGLAFTAAHEMVHGDQTNRMLARITLGILCYGHWERGHLQHHAKVGTWEDPSTARMGETFYAFAIRNVRGNLAEAWNFEARRLRTAGLPPWHPTNMFFRWAAASAAPAAAAWALFGGAGLLAFAMQACAGIFALQLADYIEHYGLERSMDPATGAPRTRVSVRDSWNADWIATNCVLFALQRHSHHHAQASRPYQKLATMDGSPQLPMSYPPLSLTALVPPLFQSIMGPRAAWQRHVSQSNSDHRAAEAEL